MLDRIARDEASHASLAWDLLAWCLRRGDESLTVAVLEAVHRASAPGLAGPPDEELRPHGRVSQRRWAEAYETQRGALRARIAGAVEGRPSLAHFAHVGAH